MSQENADSPVEIDPLVEFLEEPGAAQPVESMASSDAASAALSPPDRLDTLEAALQESQAQLAAMKLEVATLVRAVDDIKKQVRRTAVRRPVEPVAPVARTTTSQSAVAIVGLVIGIALGIGIWWRLSLETAVVPRDAQVQPADTPAPVDAPAETPSTAASPVLTPITAPVTPSRVTPVRDQPVEEEEPRVIARPAGYRGTLSIDASPGGDVFINRAKAGHTPVRIGNLRAGAHLVWIEREGYRRFTRVVEVPADRVTRVSAELEPLVTR